MVETGCFVGPGEGAMGVTRTRQIDYALRLRGEAARSGIDGNLLRIAGRATGCSITTSYREGYLHGVVRDEPGDEILIESELTITGPSSFQEIAVITFGHAGDRLHLSSCGGGVLDPLPDERGGHGAGVLRIDGGDGQFADASGLIIAAYHFSAAGLVAIAHLGAIALLD